MRRAPLSALTLLLVALLAGLPECARAAAGLPFCDSCELLAGVGATYRYFSSTRGLVVPLTLVLDDNRYELGGFRMAATQAFVSTHEEIGYRVAPYWGASLSRRWRLLRRPWGVVYVGFGGSYKTQTDALNSTRFNFAEQLGIRFNLGHNGAVAELTIRHWSNAGIKLPNRGQDFATLSFGF